MKTMTVRLATEADALSLADRLREADNREILASMGVPKESLLTGVRSPDPTYVAVDQEDVPHIIFGTSPSPSPVLGLVWMMASPEIKKCWVRLLRETSQWIDKMAEGYAVLGNMVHEENAVHILWLTWAGFVLLRRVEFNGHGFYEFARMTKSSGE